MKLEIQKFLETHSLNDLDSIGIEFRKSTRNPKKFSLNYNQIKCDSKDPRTKECRGLILEADRNVDLAEVVGETKVLAFPFRRFFNSDDPSADSIDWKTATYYTKLDGTLAIVYYDPTLKGWAIATRSVPDADVPFNAEGRTFEDLFQDTWNEVMVHGPNFRAMQVGLFQDLLHKDFTYMFELCTPENQVVVRNNKRSLTLLGYRDFKQEERDLHRFAADHLDNEWWIMSNPPAPARNQDRVYQVSLCPKVRTTSKEYQDWVNNLDLTCEGLVICDSDFNRIKCKSPAYRAAHRLKDKAISSNKNLLELILLQKDDDVRSVLEEDMLAKLDQMKQDLKAMISILDEEFEANFCESRKEFAISIQRGSGLMGVQMWRFSNSGKTFLDWLESQKKNGEFQDSFLQSMLLNLKKGN